MRYLFNNTSFKKEEDLTVEILSEKSDTHAFIARKLMIRAFNKQGKITHVGINNISIMGIPQLISYNSKYNSNNTGSSLFFEDFQEINFDGFSACPGQGIQFFYAYDRNVRNIETILMGEEINHSMVGRYEGNQRDNHILFRNESFSSNERKTLEILAGRAGIFKPKTIQIFALNKSKKKRNPLLYSFKVKGITELENINDLNPIRLNFFEKERNIDTSTICSVSNKGLQLNIENTYSEKIDVYIKLTGQPRE